MRKRLLVYIMLLCLTACSICGCGSASVHFPDVKGFFEQVEEDVKLKDTAFHAERELKTLEEKINELDIQYLKEHIYMDSIETNNEAVVAAAFLGDVLFNSAGKAFQAISNIAMHALDNYDLTSPEELEALREEWKNGLLKDLNYKMDEYEVLSEGNSGSEDEVIVRVHHSFDVGLISYSGDIHLDFVKENDMWKFHVVSGEWTE